MLFSRTAVQVRIIQARNSQNKSLKMLYNLLYIHPHFAILVLAGGQPILVKDTAVISNLSQSVYLPNSPSAAYCMLQYTTC